MNWCTNKYAPAPGTRADGVRGMKGRRDMTTTDQVVEIRAKAFAGEGVRLNKCLVSRDGTVRVWDSVAGHYTTCHSLSSAAQLRVRKMAAK